jgi:hypothetical protein
MENFADMSLADTEMLAMSISHGIKLGVMLVLSNKDITKELGTLISKSVQDGVENALTNREVTDELEVIIARGIAIALGEDPAPSADTEAQG